MRKTADCRLYPSESGCSLTISGEEEEVVRAAGAHAAGVHGHEDTAALRELIRKDLEDDGAAGRYGTVMTATLQVPLERWLEELRAWTLERRTPGFLSEQTLLADDGRTLVSAVCFADEASYRRLAEDPAQDTWWTERVAPLVTDVRWIDGTWQQTTLRAPAVPQQAGDRPRAGSPA